MRILITGSRKMTDYDLMRSEIINTINYFAVDSSTVTIVHGNAKGADALAQQVAQALGLKVEAYPADWNIGRKAGPLRNQLMVDKGADACLAFAYQDSKGTKDCAQRARKANIPIKYIKLGKWI